MKYHKKIIIAFAILIALGIIGTAIAYNTYHDIANVAITSHDNHDIVLGGHTYGLTASTAVDEDSYYNCGLHVVYDNIVYTWSGDGTFDNPAGQNVNWEAPFADNEVVLRITADDTGAPVYADDVSQYAEVTLDVQNHIYVDADAPDGGDGLTWATAFNKLQDALDEAYKGNEIWVAAGTYYPTSRRYSTEEESRSFKLKDDVKIYGGFDPGSGADEWSERDPATYEVILSGDIDEDGLLGNENAWHVVSADTDDVTPKGLINGCTITKGYADGGAPENSGGGIYNQLESPMIENCKITDNYAASVGGGIYSNASSGQSVIGCTITNNSASAGGGIYVQDASYHVVKNCIFKENIATGSNGGGLYVQAKPGQRIANCIFVDNDASTYGGGLFIKYQTPALKVTNCSFTCNLASKGGAIAIDQMNAGEHGQLAITNCILWADIGQTSYGEIYEYGGDDSYTYLNYSDIDGGFNGYKLYSENSVDHRLQGDTGNINDDPEFTYSGMNRTDTTSAAGTTSTLEVSTGVGSNYAYRDIVEYNHDGKARFVVGVDGDTIQIYPDLSSASAAGKNIYKWNNPVTPKMDQTYTSGSTNYISVIHTSWYQIGDIIEYGYDNVPRYVTGVYPNDYRVYFTPYLGSSSQYGIDIKIYGQNWEWALDFDSDCELPSGSPCIDAGNNDLVHRHDVSDYTGTNARKIDDPKTDTGHGTAPIVDIGADERGSATPPEPTTITIVALCFTDESSEYESNVTQYDLDLQTYRELMSSSDIADVFRAGCIVVDDGKAGVYPTSRPEPTDVILEDMDLPFAEGSLYNGANDKWDLIRAGVTPDYIILSRDVTGSMSGHDLDAGDYGYDDFKTWLGNTYPNAHIEEREYSTEYWLGAMIDALLNVTDEYEL